MPNECKPDYDFTAPDIYDLYVQYQRDRAASLFFEATDRERCHLKSVIRVHDRKKFWRWLDGLDEGVREDYLDRWKTGYEGIIKRRVEEARAVMRRHRELGL